MTFFLTKTKGLYSLSDNPKKRGTESKAFKNR